MWVQNEFHCTLKLYWRGPLIQTKWSGGLYKLKLEFPEEYPTKPPKCKHRKHMEVQESRMLILQCFVMFRQIYSPSFSSKYLSIRHSVPFNSRLVHKLFWGTIWGNVEPTLLVLLPDEDKAWKPAITIKQVSVDCLQYIQHWPATADWRHLYFFFRFSLVFKVCLNRIGTRWMQIAN